MAAMALLAQKKCRHIRINAQSEKLSAFLEAGTWRLLNSILSSHLRGTFIRTR